MLDALRRTPGPVPIPSLRHLDALTDDDLQLALSCCYELHYLSFAGVDDGWEWEPGLLAVRRELERSFAARLIAEIGPTHPLPAAEVAAQLEDLANGAGPSLSSRLLESGTRAEFREFVAHRSIYQRKEADPHTWVIPRVRGRVKAAVVAIQYDEYGDGVA